MEEMRLEDLHEAHFEWNGDSYLTFQQSWDAKDWMKRHLLHVFGLIKDLDKGYPPTLQEDKNNPGLWKAEHWFWFVNYYIKQ
jgi:hypothetical protein